MGWPLAGLSQVGMSGEGSGEQSAARSGPCLVELYSFAARKSAIRGRTICAMLWQQ